MQKRVRLNRVIEMFEAGVAPMGIFAFNASMRSAAAMAEAPMDFIILDLEHTPFGVEHLESFLLALTDKARILEKGNLQPDVVPLVRLPSYGSERIQYLMKQALDLGVFGVVAPTINTADEALHAVAGMRFAQAPGAPDFYPEGRRGVGYPWAARYWGIPGPEYAARADLWPLDPDGELLLWCMIETREGMENCRAIARTPGVGGILIGPSDLSMSLEGRKGGSAVQSALATIQSICKEEHVPCGLAVSASDAMAYLNAGFDFLVAGIDTGLPAGVEQALQRVRAERARRAEAPTSRAKDRS
ncbi:MAG: HpcH/HpaI aldolase family protein [Terracidiphilus sp.]